MLIAARSSHDLACCWRAIVSARSKYTSAFTASARATSARFLRRCGGCRLRTTFLWLLLLLLSLRQCSAKRHRIGRGPHRLAPNMISSHGVQHVAPDDRIAVIPEVIISIASDALPVRLNTQPCKHLPSPSNRERLFRPPTRPASSNCEFAAT